MEEPEILTRRLRLSRLVASDAPAMYEYRSDPEVCRYQSFEPGSLAEVEAFINESGAAVFNKAGSWFQFAIRLLPSGVLNHLFVDMQKHRVFASVDPRNEPSVSLLERAGMRLEAHFRESLWFKGEWADDMIFGILKPEWDAQTRSGAAKEHD